MNDITGLLLIGMGAMATVLIIAAIRDKEAEPTAISGSTAVNIPANQPDRTLMSQISTPLIVPTSPEMTGPVLPAGLIDTMDPSRLDYIQNATNRREMEIYWSRFPKYNPYIYEAARITQVPNNIIRAIMIVESSVVNAKPNFSTGLMQVSMLAAKHMGYTGDKTGLYTDPRQNIILGAKYLAYQYKRYGFDWNQAFAAYNFGSVHRWSKGVTPVVGITGDKDWAAIVNLVAEGKITQFKGVHSSAGYGPIVNQGYVDKTNKWWGILNQVIIVK